MLFMAGVLFTVHSYCLMRNKIERMSQKRHYRRSAAGTLLDRSHLEREHIDGQKSPRERARRIEPATWPPVNSFGFWFSYLLRRGNWESPFSLRVFSAGLLKAGASVQTSSAACPQCLRWPYGARALTLSIIEVF